ncbi:hypothetical protein GQX74_005637 [Glossina fuscipes]|nr:hypothetical protein GQX74_005637 [Glossina fuscipes]
MMEEDAISVCRERRFGLRVSITPSHRLTGTKCVYHFCDKVGKLDKICNIYTTEMIVNRGGQKGLAVFLISSLWLKDLKPFDKSGAAKDIMGPHFISCLTKLVLVLPPIRKEVDQLYTHIHAFSLMTYDYSSVHRPGAHAPLYWIRRTSEKLIPTNSQDFNEKHQKILLGINMYGNDLTPL